MAVPARKMQPARVPARRPRPARQPAKRTTPARRPASRPAARKQRRGVPFALFALIVVALMVVTIVTAQALVAQESFRLTALSERAETLEDGYGELRLKAAELSAPERIAEAAVKAGLVLPEEVEVIKVPGEPEAAPHAETVASGSNLAIKALLGDEG